MRRPPVVPGVAPLGALQEHSPPTIGRRIAERSERLLPGFGVVRAWTQFEHGFDGEAVGMPKPAGVVLEGSGSPAPAPANP